MRTSVVFRPEDVCAVCGHERRFHNTPTGMLRACSAPLPLGCKCEGFQNVRLVTPLTSQREEAPWAHVVDLDTHLIVSRCDRGNEWKPVS